MKKEWKLVGPLLLVAIIALLLVPAAHAGTTWKLGSGWFDMSITDQGESWVNGNVIIAHYWGGGGYDYGTLEGKWIHDGIGEWDFINLKTGIVRFFGFWDTPDGCTFDGVKGKISVYYWGTADANTGAFQGQWVIVCGTGGLANLKGYGTVWSTAAGIQNVPPIGWYTINYWFCP